MVAHRMIDEKEIFLLLEQDTMLDKAFGFILDKYQERLYWHIRRMVGSHEDANDVFQNTMIKAYKGI
jgi:RNA polymerase sigma-70 factor (ECF subfamily)